ncbi:hypothetical protein IscW_ISCW009594 [Ixodes scapularis]|uniref:Uncharacterized protein n=1 Tax=Ixodes scapularis TaxID=6945 RepID=B7Q189_IXOSC|nr:hypothetical protein IscW_ISCW009594 [Ixodes scapularis]|eukprot:XP_002409122.1 hypothetical protein IscW_ISCW009594 [Ixodes scapularis]
MHQKSATIIVPSTNASSSLFFLIAAIVVIIVVSFRKISLFCYPCLSCNQDVFFLYVSVFFYNVQTSGKKKNKSFIYMKLTKFYKWVVPVFYGTCIVVFVKLQ